MTGWGVGGGGKQEGEDSIGMTGGWQHVDKRRREWETETLTKLALPNSIMPFERDLGH